jgi:hypothetical protein
MITPVDHPTAKVKSYMYPASATLLVYLHTIVQVGIVPVIHTRNKADVVFKLDALIDK